MKVSLPKWIEQKMFPQRQKRRVLLKRILIVAGIVAIPLTIYSYFTNPFVRFSLVRDPYHEIYIHDNEIDLTRESSPVILSDSVFSRQLAVAKSGWHILTSKFAGGPKAKAGSVDEIIAQIHALRFNPDEPFLISGDHFSVLYPRSLGIFYHSLLDPRTALSPTDWQNRQIIYLKTLAYALQVYSQSSELSTTIVPVGPRSVALMNIYATPSDTLYSLLYGLSATESTEVHSLYPFEKKNDYTLQTTTASAQLQDTYRASLQAHLDTYNRTLRDPATGLIRTDLALSGVKDMSIRSSSFYDNVIMWRTLELADELALQLPAGTDHNALKETILKTFFVDSLGCFAEELPSVKEARYSSDWLIAYQTGMLRPENPEDQELLLSCISYIRKNAIDKPFAIQYHADNRPEQLYLPVRIAAPAYGSTAIWSNWGMEYIKLLTHISYVTQDPSLLTVAESHLDEYRFNIKRYRGYPEVYDENGDFFRQRFYKSIRQTGWVVTFEQAEAFHEWVETNFANSQETRYTN